MAMGPITREQLRANAARPHPLRHEDRELADLGMASAVAEANARISEIMKGVRRDVRRARIESVLEVAAVAVWAFVLGLLLLAVLL